MKIEELIAFVRKNSEFYRTLYRDLPEGAGFQDLPVVNQEEYWKANSLHGNRVLTGPMKDGVVFKSGGTTGNPKFSVFSQREWRELNQAFGRALATGGIQAGDRVVNLFYVGQLYGSFLFINKSFEESPVGVLQLPVGGTTDFAETRQILREFKVNVLAGVPTTILNLAESIAAEGGKPSEYPVTRILFGGEPFYPDQRERVAEIFPGVTIQSIGYASTDAGLIGYVDTGCAPGEHRAFSADTILEILDEDTHEPIREPGREGVLVITQSTRTLMPILRYPVGDRGKWIEPIGTPDRKYLLMGRSEEAARIGMVKLYVQDVRDALEPLHKKLGVIDFQLLIIHRDRLDGLVLRVSSALDRQELARHDADLVQAIHRVRPLYEQFVQESKVLPIEIEWVPPGGLETNSRTGKMRRVIDRRHG